MADLNNPPFGQPFTDKNGYISSVWRRWLTALHNKLGGTDSIIPASSGGTGVDNVASLAATIGTASTDTSSGTALTQTKTQALTRPATADFGDSEDTVITWATPFADSSYQPTVAFDPSVPRRGSVTIASKTAADITVTLTNTTDGLLAQGTAVVTGVHT